MTFERKILRRIDSPITEIGEYRRTNNEVHHYTQSPISSPLLEANG